MSTTVEPILAPNVVEPEPDRATMTRALRELEAAKARVERDARQVHDDTRTKLVVELLPVLDNLDRTLRAAVDHGEPPALVDGVRQVRAQLDAVLRGYGVERIDAIGRPFDPKIHDAISLVPVADPARHALVLDQAEPGYQLGERLLRPAKVVVGRAITPAPVVPPRVADTHASAAAFGARAMPSVFPSIDRWPSVRRRG